MNKFINFSLLFIFTAHISFAQLPTPVVLPNGWSLSPAGRNFPLGDLPLNIAVSHNGKRMAVTNNGQSVQSIQLIDPAAEKVLHTVVIPKAWYGLAFADDDKSLFVSGGHDNQINQYNIIDNKLVFADSFLLGTPWPKKIGPAGIAIDNQSNKIFVVTREDSSLYVIDIPTKKILNKMPLGAEGYACVLSPKKDRLYVSVWGGDEVLQINTKDYAVTARVVVGDNPNEICMSKKGEYIYVANANDNAVSVIRTSTMKVIETLNAALFADAVPGATSNGVSLSADEKRLYIANADNNSLAVFDVTTPGKSSSLGFIPVGWYPTNVKVLGKKSKLVS